MLVLFDFVRPKNVAEWIVVWHIFATQIFSRITLMPFIYLVAGEWSELMMRNIRKNGIVSSAGAASNK